MTPFPPIPTGDSRLVEWARRIQQLLQERTIIAGPGVVLKHTPQGVIVTAAGGGGRAPDVALEEVQVCIDGDDEWYINVHTDGEPPHRKESSD